MLSPEKAVSVAQPPCLLVLDLGLVVSLFVIHSHPQIDTYLDSLYFSLVEFLIESHYFLLFLFLVNFSPHTSF